MPLIKCLQDAKVDAKTIEALAAKSKELQDKNGLSEVEADRKVKNEYIVDEHNKLAIELHEVKKEAGLVRKNTKPPKPIKYSEPDLTEINKKYEEQKKNVKPEAEIKPPPPEPIVEEIKTEVKLEEKIIEKPTGGEPPKEPPLSETSDVHSEEPNFTLKKAELSKVRAEMGLGDFEGEKVSSIEAITKADRTITEWKDKGIYGKEIGKVIDSAMNGEISDDGQNILAQHIADLRLKAKGITDRNSAEYDNALTELNKAVEAGDVLRSAAGRILGRQLQVRPKTFDSVLDVELDMLKDYGVDELTPTQKAEAEKRFNEINGKLTNEAQLRIKAEEEVERLKAENELLKAKKTTVKNTPAKRNKTTDDYKKERENIVKSIKDKWNNAGKDILSSDIPYRKQLSAIAPDVFRLIHSYAEETANITLDAVRKLLKKDIEDAGIAIKDEDVRALISGAFNEKKAPRSELVAKVYELRQEEKLLIEYEAALKGEKPTNEKALRKRNERLADLRKKIKDVEPKEEKTNSQRLEDAKKATQKRMDKIREEIINKERELKEKQKPLNEDLELTRLKEEESDLKELRDKYLPTEKDPHEAEKQRERIKDKLYDDIISINEQINAGERIRKEKKNNFSDDTELNKLRKLKEAKEEILEEIDPLVSDERKLEFAKRIAEKSIAKLEKKIAENDLAITEKAGLTDAELNALREKQKQLRKELEAKRKEQKLGRYSDDARFQRSINQRIAATKKQQAHLLEKIKKGDFAEDVKEPDILENTELQRKNKKLYDEYLQSVVDKDNALQDYETKRLDDKISNSGVLQKLGYGVDVVFATSKGAVAMFDQSGVLVQMILTTGAHPLKTIENLPRAIRDLVDNRWFDRSLAKLKGSKIWDLVEKTDLAIYDPHGIGEDVRNELLGGRKNLLNRDITIAGKKFSVGKALERSTSTLFNHMRMYLFENSVNQLYAQGKTWENAPEEFKSAARAINELTGHGKVQEHLAMASPVLNKLIWSPKMISSTLNVLGLGDLVRPIPALKEIGKAAGFKNIKDVEGATKGFYSSLTPTQRKFMAKELTRAVGTVAAIMIAAKLTNAADDVDLDPLSPTFGSLKKGDKTVNLLGRYGSAIRTIAQVVLNKRRINGKIDTLGDKYGEKTAGDVAFSAFGRGKFTPAAGLGYDYFLNSKENYYTHEPITPLSAAKSMVIPISFQQIGKDFKRDGALSGTIQTLYNIYGGSIYDKSEFSKKPDNFTEEDKKDITFKYFTDRGMELPNVSLSTPVTDEKAGTIKNISDYPKETQDKYLKAHKEEFKKALSEIKSNKLVYTKTYTNAKGEKISTVYFTKPDGTYKTGSIDKLSKEEMAQVKSYAQGQATTAAKEKIFPPTKKVSHDF